MMLKGDMFNNQGKASHRDLEHIAENNKSCSTGRHMRIEEKRCCKRRCLTTTAERLKDSGNINVIQKEMMISKK